MQQVVVLDLANCQEWDYKLRMRIDELGMTLRDEEPTALATGFKQSLRDPKLSNPEIRDIRPFRVC